MAGPIAGPAPSNVPAHHACHSLLIARSRHPAPRPTAALRQTAKSLSWALERPQLGVDEPSDHRTVDLLDQVRIGAVRDGPGPPLRNHLLDPRRYPGLLG